MENKWSEETLCQLVQDGQNRTAKEGHDSHSERSAAQKVACAEKKG